MCVCVWKYGCAFFFVLYLISLPFLSLICSRQREVNRKTPSTDGGQSSEVQERTKEGTEDRRGIQEGHQEERRELQEGETRKKEEPDGPEKEIEGSPEND